MSEVILRRFVILAPARASYYAAVGGLVLLAVLGLVAAHEMEVHGHHITGMNNQVVWGIPHVFAIALILAASGALNAASMASVFGVDTYAPAARLSAMLAVALLLGGLLVLVLDLGRPDRLVVALTHYNFTSVFAWNLFLYGGFIAVVAVYLWAMFESHPRARRRVRGLGVAAFLWRFILTSGTGAIFGFLIARPAYNAAILVPMFILLSLSMGGAVLLLVVAVLGRWRVGFQSDLSMRLGRLLAAFLAGGLFLTGVFHLTNLYAAEHHALERFILRDGGVYTALFWLGQVGVGGVLPLILLLAPGVDNIRVITIAAVLALLGGFAQLYVIIIGGQAFPVDIFPGKTVSSSFYDGQVVSYAPSMPEFLLGFGGVAVALLVLLLVLRVLPCLPETSAATARK